MKQMRVSMSTQEKVNQVLRMMYDVLDVGRLFGKAEAYQYMFDLLKKSHFITSNPKLMLNTICLSLDSGSDSLEKARNYLKDSSPTVTKQVDILINTISTLSDNIRIATNEGKYEEAFDHIKKASKDIKRFMKENEATFKVYMEVQRKRLEDMFK